MSSGRASALNHWDILSSPKQSKLYWDLNYDFYKKLNTFKNLTLLFFSRENILLTKFISKHCTLEILQENTFLKLLSDRGYCCSTIRVVPFMHKTLASIPKVCINQAWCGTSLEAQHLGSKCKTRSSKISILDYILSEVRLNYEALSLFFKK